MIKIIKKDVYHKHVHRVIAGADHTATIFAFAEAVTRGSLLLLVGAIILTVIIIVISIIIGAEA